MRSLKRLGQRGVSLVELVIAVAIMATMASSVILARGLMAKQTVRTDDRAFATQKAIQMFGELKSLVSGSETGVQILDNYSDGTYYNTVLTTDKNVDTSPPGSGNAANVLSGNRKSNGNWRFLRQISVVPLVNDTSARLVSIKVWLYAGDRNPGQPGELLSEVSGIMRTSGSLANPTQVLDVYFLAINNIQGWWSQVPSLASNIKQAINDVELTSNNTLQIRPHYITRTSYGEDLQYVPYINAATSTSDAVSPWLYLYPGLVHEDAVTENSVPLFLNTTANFYQPDSGLSGVVQDGNFNIDGTITTPGFLTGGVTYAVADQYNHSVRYPDELATYQAVTAAYVAAGGGAKDDPVTELSERMLLENMLSQPASYQNALLVNLHGELLPLPPMQNYSDPAKDPANLPYYRVVTHPENLYYPLAAGAATVNLRVYGYLDGFDAVTQINAYPATSVASMPMTTVSITLPGLSLTSAQIAAIQATAIYGDVNHNYTALPVTSGGTTGVAGMGMSIFSSAASVYVNSYGQSVTGYTRITLTNTPFRCPQATGGGTNGSGLNANDRLYGLEYIPCSPDAGTGATSFTGKSLTVTSSTSTTAVGNPKNTACWIIPVPIPIQNANSPQEIDTRLVSNTSAFPNLSKTYVWVGNNDPPPYTERYQFMGDPRDCPYLDVKVGGAGGGAATILAYSYNWFFKNITNGATGVDGYKNFADTSQGWGNSGDGVNLDIDLPRFYQVLRNALFSTTSIFGTVNGWSFYYYGMGGELGYDQDPYANGVSYIQAPWATTAAGAAATSTSDEIITQSWASANTKYARIPANVGKTGLATDAWYAKPWLGELYPDSQYLTYWSVYGNLPSMGMTALHNNTDPVTFYREDYANIPLTIATGSAVTNSLNGFHGSGNHFGKSASEPGCTSFYNGTNGTGVFRHFGSGNTGNTYSLADSCYNIFNYSFSGSVSCIRPWSFSFSASSANTPTEWSATGTNSYTSKNSLSFATIGSSGVTDLFYNSDQGSNYQGAGVVEVTNPSSTAIFYTVESGLATSSGVGTNTLGTYALLYVLRTFLDGGMLASPGNVGHIAQLPLIQVYVDSATAQYDNPTAIGVTIASPVETGTPASPVTDLWYRFPGFTSTSGNFYTELYPGYNNLLSSTYDEMSGSTPVTLLYNLKYSADGVTWYHVSDGLPAKDGVLGTAATEAVTVTTSAPVTYSWNVSNSTNFPQGKYILQGEAYRLGYGLHYSFHDISVHIDR